MEYSREAAVVCSQGCQPLESGQAFFLENPGGVTVASAAAPRLWRKTGNLLPGADALAID